MKKEKLDVIDKKILKSLQEDSTKGLEEIGNELKISKSTVHYRVKKLLDSGIIKGFQAIVDPTKVGYDILAISLINGKYGLGFDKEVGDQLKKIKGVWGVYFLLGDIDFVVMLRAKNREDLKRIIDEFMSTEGIERSNTYIILDRIKEDFRVEL